MLVLLPNNSRILDVITGDLQQHLAATNSVINITEITFTANFTANFIT